MATKLEQAAQQALKALIDSDDGGGLRYTEVQAVAALREALAEPDIEEMTLTQIAARHEQAEQEPVVKIHKYNEFQTLGSLNLPIGTKLYAAPVRTKDLTDDEISRLWYDSSYGDSGIDFARAVIAKYKEKNRG